jgi:DNA-binding transcriptional ArsR family regulator
VARGFLTAVAQLSISICEDSPTAKRRACGFDNLMRRHILNQMVQYSSPNLDRVLGAVSDPTRRAILDRLSHGPARISDLAAPFSMSLTGFCKHVRVLEKARLVRRTRRGRDNTLALSRQPLRHASRWFLKYEQFWNVRLDRLEQFFAKQKEKP